MRNVQTLRGAFLLAIAGIVAISSASALRAEAPAADTKPPAFEVASVKPHNPDDQQVMMVAHRVAQQQRPRLSFGRSL